MADNKRPAVYRLAALGAVLTLMFCVCARPAAASRFTATWDYDSKSAIDSTRKDSYTVEYPAPLYTPVAKPVAYDKSFVSTVQDLNFTLRGDLSERHFIDIKETFHYQGYRPEDEEAFALDTYKYSALDHSLDLTYGLSVGEADLLRFDYVNAAYRLPLINIFNYTSNMAKARYDHRAGDHTGLGFEGSYEEREFADDRDANYEEGNLSIDLSAFLPERLHYTPVSSSIRGERSTFERIPTGMATQKAVNAYTDWTRRPGEPDPQARFVSRVARGALYLSLTGNLKRQRRTTIDNGFDQPSGTLRATYEANPQTSLTLEETYYSRKHDKESDASSLFNHDSNKLSLSGEYRPSGRFLHLMTLYDERYTHTTHEEHDYRVDAFLWENYFTGKRTAASLNLKATRTRHGTPRLFYADSDEYQMIFGYDYPFTPTWLLHLKDEWIDTKFDQFEDLVLSSNTRHTWRVGVEKQLSTSQSLELGYQSRRERHTTYTANNIVEKSLIFSWLSNF